MNKKNLSENIEEYLEVLYKYGDKDNFVSTTKISQSLKIAPGSVTQMLKKLENKGYVFYEAYKGAKLSNKGFKIAKKITRKHRILEKFLSDVLNIKEENIHQQACDMEHSLSDEAERAICHLLEHPDFSPNKKPIPACDFDYNSCQDCIGDEHKDINEIGLRSTNLISVAQLRSNEKGEVSFIRGDESILRELIAKGIAIGTVISFIGFNIDSNQENDNFNQKNDDLDTEIITNDLNIIVNNTKVNLSKDLANNVFVKVITK
ncbi:MAG: metal-dependent transcriptional regulator [Methanobrevibacter sp.]|jgi:DtxR family Mn-dependent transcriptional regulator|nr:metal-dependent transcriptional regulator [Candidatus Methanoflexus mossambicus]